jgi:CheY-like chemotaxis protein
MATGDMQLPHHQPPSNLRRLQPLRVLLAGRDRRFLRVTAFLLSRRGYDVSEAPLSDSAPAADRFHADVVLLDAGMSRAEAARLANQLTALPSPPAVLVVSANGHKPGAGLRVVEKWEPIDDLVKEIEAASLERHPPALRASGAHEQL